MIHQLLVSMAGYRADLADKLPQDLWNQSEKAMVLQAEKMGELAYHVQQTVSQIQDSSILVTSVGHAVAKVIDQQICQQYIAELVVVEQQILRKDPSLVGSQSAAVSLTQIITIAVRTWQRVFLYARQLLKELVTNKRSSVEILAILRRDVESTGYNDVLKLAQQCLEAAEKSWLIQVSCWLLYGTLPYSSDFMLSTRNNNNRDSPDGLGNSDFVVVDVHVPKCIKYETALDILDIGKSLVTTRTLTKNDKNATFIMKHASKLLQSVQLPLDAGQFAGVVKDIKQLVFSSIISENVSPASSRLFLHLLRQVALLESSEFSYALLDQYWQNRLRTPALSLTRLFSHAFNTMVEEGINALDSQLFEYEDCLKVIKQPNIEHGAGADLFSDLVFNLPCSLSFKFKWPYSILVSDSTLQNYSHLFNYLLSIRYIRYQLTKHFASRRGQKLGATVCRLLFVLRLLWDVLWAHCQIVIDQSFKQSLSGLFTKDYQSVIDEHEEVSSAMLKRLVAVDPEQTTHDIPNLIRSLFLGTSAFLQTISRAASNPMVLADAQTELVHNLSQVPVLVNCLSNLSHLTPEMTHLLVQLEPLASSQVLK